MSPLTETILYVFGLIALGYLSGLTGYLSTQTGDAISQFAVGVALPMLLFRTMMQIDFHGAAPWSLWGTYFLAASIVWTMGHLVTTRLFGRDALTGLVGGVSACFSNIVLLGIPFIQSLYGQPGFEVVSLLIAVHLPTMIVTSVILFGLFGRKDGPRTNALGMAGDVLRRMLTNPLIVGMVAGLLWRFTGLGLPSLAARLVDALAGVAGIVALFALGLGLRKFGISGNVRTALVLSILKLFLMPATVLAIALAVDLPPLVAKVAVTTAALPSGVNSYLIATQFGVGQGLASNQMVIATAFSVATLAFWATLIQTIYP